MRNIELKARTPDIESAEERARSIPGATFHTRIRQVDTYYRIPTGRLKLREITGDETRGELVFYRRPTTAGPKRSDYEVASVADPVALKRLLEAAFSVRCVVDKKRTVYLARNVRIHLDLVDRLGTFVEFEAVIRDDEPDDIGERQVRTLMERFGIAPADLVEESYADLVVAAT